MCKKKKMLKLLSLVCLALPFNTFAQTQVSDSVQKEEGINRVITDSIQISYLKDIANNSESIDRYKLYPTQNTWTFIKLDTSTGKVWQVQYGLKDSKRLELPISLKELAYYSKIGRFELYPTQNMYNFMLLDKYMGWVYQVQWSFDAEKRFIVEIK